MLLLVLHCWCARLFLPVTPKMEAAEDRSTQRQKITRKRVTAALSVVNDLLLSILVIFSAVPSCFEMVDYDV